MVMFIIILVDSLRRWIGIWTGRNPSPLCEAPYVASQILATAPLHRTRVDEMEKPDPQTARRLYLDHLRRRYQGVSRCC